MLVKKRLTYFRKTCSPTPIQVKHCKEIPAYFRDTVKNMLRMKWG